MAYVIVGVIVFLFLMFLGNGLRTLKLEEAMKSQIKINENIDIYFKQQNVYLGEQEDKVKTLEFAVNKLGEDYVENTSITK